jgi:O-antigen/teichoic acid export membrane protein
LWVRAGLSVRSVANHATWTLLKEYRRFPFFTSTAALVTTLGLNLPAIQLAEYFNMAESGHFSFSLRILGLPIVLVGQAVAQVFYPAAAERELDSRGNEAFISRVATVLAVIALPTFTLLALYGTELFAFAFGAEWRQAGRYSQILAPMYLMAFVSSPVSSYAMVRGKQLQILAITILEAAARFGAIRLGARLGSPVASVTAFSVVGCVIYLAYLIWVLHLSGQGFLRWIGGLGSYLTMIIALAVPLALLRLWSGERLWFAQVVVGTAVLGGPFVWRARSALKPEDVSGRPEAASERPPQ